jgi:uncharacterized damage-inducible protein DinB
MSDPRYPIGQPEKFGPFSDAERAAMIDRLAAAPAALRAAVAGLSDAQLDTPYRDGGWTVRQVVHHIADSHINAYTRFKFTCAEDNPTMKGYNENVWAAHRDATTLPVEVSLRLIEGLHARLVEFLRSLKPQDFARRFTHTENGPRDVDWLLAIYSWHGAHHTAHITSLRAAQGW